MIYDCAKKELGDSIRGASVSVYHDHYEPVPPSLVLTIVADIDAESLGRVHRSLAESIALESLLWTASERSDFANSIQYEFIALRI